MEYYEIIRQLVPVNGEMPLDKKRKVADYLKEHPSVSIARATDNEIGAILNYLNHKCLECDMFGDNPPYLRFKDAVLCLNENQTEWLLLDREPEELLWDVWYFMNNKQDDSVDFSSALK